METVEEVIKFDLCPEGGGLDVVFGIIKILLNLIRFVVPIALIIWIIIDLFRNVINIDDKESKMKIVNRIAAAIIVFLVPTIVSLVMNLVTVGLNNSGDLKNYPILDCWNNAGNDNDDNG